MKDEIKEIMEECFKSTKVAAKVLFPQRFYRPFSSLHDQIFKVLDDDSLQQVVIVAPRGFGKTTIDTIAYPGKKILFREKKFIVPVSATATSAVLQGENLKRELTHSHEISAIFGNLKTKSFSKEQWITSNGVMVMPRGAGQQIRGILHDRYRPDLIVVDDLEDAEKVNSDEQRAKLKEWFFSDLCNSIDRSRKDWKIVVIGTILHEDCLLLNLVNDPDWHSVELSLCDDDFHSNWPDFMKDEEVIALKNAHERRGQLDLFFREYMGKPISTVDATFRQEYFNHYSVGSNNGPENAEAIVIVDPAKTVKLHSADSAIVGVQISREDHRIWFDDCVSGKLYPDELYDEIFGMVQRLGANILAIEVTSLNEFILQPIKNEMRRRGVFPRLIELKARDKKPNRIAQMVPYYRQGFVWHRREIAGKLEGQLLSFPRSKLWDVMDAFAYFIEVLEMEGAYFDPPGMEDDEECYAMLENDEPLEWRAY